MDKEDRVLTEAVFEKKFAEGMGDFARLVNKGFAHMETRMDGMEDAMRSLTQRVDGIEKELRGMHQKLEAFSSELRGIRDQLKEVDTRADVIDLDIRVSRLEKKVGIKRQPIV